MPSISVKGMTCQHCAAAVKKELETIDGVTDVQVDVETGRVSYEGSAPEDLLRKHVEEAGYEYEGPAG